MNTTHAHFCAAKPHPALRDQPSAVLRPSALCSLPPEGAFASSFSTFWAARQEAV